MQLKTMLAVAATAAAVPLGAAWATQPTGPQGTFLWNDSYRSPAFSTMDRNGDGIVTRDEYAAATGTVPAVAPVVSYAPVAPSAVYAAPVVVQPAPVPHYAPVPRYSWFSADSNPPAPPQ
jgi:hypothetical protein